MSGSPTATMLWVIMAPEKPSFTMVNADLMAEMFVRALLLNTDPIANEAHKIAPAPCVIWEDIYELSPEQNYVKNKPNIST